MIAPSRLLQTTLLATAITLVGCASAPAGREADEALLKDPLLSEAKVAHEVVSEAFITALTPADNLDSPASWMTPDGSRWVIATAKGTHALVVFDGDSGKRLRVVGGKGKALGKLDRPNGISVVDDLVFVVERDNRRVQVFSLPDFKTLTAFGKIRCANLMACGCASTTAATRWWSATTTCRPPTRICRRHWPNLVSAFGVIKSIRQGRVGSPV